MRVLTSLIQRHFHVDFWLVDALSLESLEGDKSNPLNKDTDAHRTFQISGVSIADVSHDRVRISK